MSRLYTIHSAANPAGVHCTEDPSMSTSTDGAPAGVVLVCNVDVIRSRAHLLELFATLRTAVLADKPLG